MTGERVPGVTTVLKKLDKPAIVQWAVDNTAAFAVANIDALLNRTEEQGYGFLRWYWKRDPLKGDMSDIRNYSNGVLNDAAELGTLIHEWIEADHGHAAYPNVKDAPPFFWEMVEQWNQLNERHEIVPVYSEVTFWSHCYGYAGTADGVWLIDGVPCLIDIKSSRNTWDEQRIQLAALGACDAMLNQKEDGSWEELAMPDFKEYKLIHIRPSDYDKSGFPMDPFANIIDVPHEEMDVLFEQFLGLLRVSHAQNRLKEIRKGVLDSSEEE